MCSKVINWVSDNLKVKDNSHQNQDFFRASINPENLASKKCPKMPKKKSGLSSFAQNTYGLAYSWVSHRNIKYNLKVPLLRNNLRFQYLQLIWFQLQLLQQLRQGCPGTSIWRSRSN